MIHFNLFSLNRTSEFIFSMTSPNIRANSHYYRGSKISSLKSEIKKLKCLPMLRGLILKDSPVAKEEEYRIEIIMNLRNLERLDKDIFTDEERQEAQEVRNGLA